MKLGKGHLSRHILFTLALIVCLVWATSAFGAVGLGSPSPAAGASVASPVSFSIKAADASSELKVVLCNIVVKDASGNAVVGLPASTVVDGVIKLDGAVLSAGNYTACATAVDTKLKVYSLVWAFDIGGSSAGIVFTSEFPAGVVAGASVEIGATYTGADPASADVVVNGTAYAATVDAGKISVVLPGSVLIDGVNNVVVVAGADSVSFSFTYAAPYAEADCLGCHADIMDFHKFTDDSGCDPCHGANSPYGGGYSGAANSPHGDKTGSCVNSECHGSIAGADPNVLLPTCMGCHSMDPADVHHEFAVEDPACIRCHAIGTPAGTSACSKCHSNLMDLHHAWSDAATGCPDCHPSVVAQATPLLSSSPNLNRKTVMTHLKSAATAGTGDPWLDNGNPATRKSECADCHEVTAIVAGDALAGARGYKPDYAGVGNFEVPTVYIEVSVGKGGAGVEYLCVKCHGGPASAAGTTVDMGAEGRTEAANNTGGNNANGFNRTYIRGDIAREFNPANVSGHRVFPDADGVFRGKVQVRWNNITAVRGWYAAPGATGGPSVASGWATTGKVGTNLSNPSVETTIVAEAVMPIRSLTSWFKTDVDGKAWAYDSQMTCTDCHTALAGSGANGPHGANVKFALDARFPRDWKFAIPAGMTGTTATNNNIICAKCHNLNEVAGSTSPAAVHRRSDHTGRPCVTCHTAIPHGSNRPRLLSEWWRDDAAYTGQQYGYAVGAASINILALNNDARNLSNLTGSSNLISLTDSALASSNYAWGSGASANCTRGCGQHGSPGATMWYWE